MDAPLEQLQERLTAVDENQDDSARREKINILTQLARQLWPTDPQQGMSHAQAAHQLANQIPVYPKGVADSLYGMAVMNVQYSHYEQALNQLFEALSIYEALDDLEWQGNSFYVIGSTYHYMGAYPEALEYILKSIPIRHKLGNQKGMASALNMMGMIQDAAGEHVESLRYFQQAIQIHRETEDVVNEAVALNNHAVAHLALANFDEALIYGQQSLRLAQEHGIKSLEPTILCSIGEIYLQTADYPQAQHYFHESITAAQQIGTQYAKLHAHINLGNLYCQQNQPEQALTHLQQALQTAQETASKPEMVKCHYQLALAYKEQGNFKQALHHHEQFHTLKEELFNEKTDHRVKALKIQHQTETAQQEAEIYRLQNGVLENEIAERRRIEVALRRSEQQLKTLLTELDRRVQKRTQELIEANERLRELDSIKSKFIEDVSHELRTPITNINLYLDLWTHGKPENRTRYEAVLRENTRRLIHLSEAVLRVTHMNLFKGDVLLSPVDLNDVVMAVVTNYQPQAAAAGLALHYEPTPNLPLVSAETARLQQAITCVVDNAIRYTSAGQVQICFVVNEKQRRVYVQVTDTGMGFEMAERPYLFKQFYRGKNVGQLNMPGIGLGLYIAKEIMDLHGGGIEAESQLGEGSTFHLWLPIPK